MKIVLFASLLSVVFSLPKGINQHYEKGATGFNVNINLKGLFEEARNMLREERKQENLNVSEGKSYLK